MGVGTKNVLDLIDSGVLPAAQLGKGYIVKVDDVRKHIDLVIAAQTSKRREAKQGKPILNDTPAKRGRKRNAIPALPGI